MKKFLQITLIACAVMLVVLILPKTAFADGDPEGFSGDLYYYTSYVPTSSNSFVHVARNESATQDSVTYTVSRERYYSDAYSAEVDADFLVASCGISVEVAFGYRDTVTTSCTYSIPAYSETTCYYGSEEIDAYGYVEHWFRSMLVSTRNIHASYTHGSYSRKTVVYL